MAVVLLIVVGEIDKLVLPIKFISLHPLWATVSKHSKPTDSRENGR